jgi:hypothetical protein
MTKYQEKEAPAKQRPKSHSILKAQCNSLPPIIYYDQLLKNFPVTWLTSFHPSFLFTIITFCVSFNNIEIFKALI